MQLLLQVIIWEPLFLLKWDQRLQNESQSSGVHLSSEDWDLL